MEVSKIAPGHRVFLLSHGRTGCHLLERLLSVQPNTNYAGHFFAPARALQLQLLQQEPHTSTPVDLQEQYKQAFQSAYTTLEAFLDDARKANRVAFFHVHPHFMVSPVLISQFMDNVGVPPQETDYSTSYDLGSPSTNPSVLPDSVFHSAPTTAIFTIRNPLIMVPSAWRIISKVGETTPEVMRFTATFHWSRVLYDWCVAHGVRSVIVDAKEYLSPKTVKQLMTKLCEQTGLDIDHVIYEWPKASEEQIAQLPEHVAVILSDIMNSTGLRPDKDAGEVVAEQEEEKWKREFGEDIAMQLKDLVARTMPDYLHMREKAIRVEE